MYKHILHATDLSENHFNTCKKAIKLAESLGAKLYFLHVVEIPSSLQWAQSMGFAELAKPVTEGAQTVMGTLSDALKIPAANLFVETGSAYMHILSKIKELNCDLVILGGHAPNSLPAFMGSTAHAVLHHATCDVLTIRNEPTSS
ncbi:MAG: universal stress protein [Legionella sp.]|nr:universal stress protein [Legionella sp.]